MTIYEQLLQTWCEKLLELQITDSKEPGIQGRNYRTENAEDTKNAIREIFTQEDSL
ncbi:MAG: hypothetical protein RR593_07385 [Hungatella sp.]